MEECKLKCRQILPLLMLLLLALSCVSAGRKHPHEHNHEGQKILQMMSSMRSDKWHKSQASMDGKISRSLFDMEEVEDENEEGLKALGSRPPSCTDKCGRCIPCRAALQIPATVNHQRVQYTNYEHEGWKCKCGSSIYNP